VPNAWLEKTLSTFTHELRQLLKEDLIAVVLYGSGAGANFVPDLSDINVAIVVKTVSFEVLQKLQPRMAAWHKQRFAMPLLLDQEFLQRARDVFPMEFHDIQEQHRLLWGEDVFQDLSLDSRHLRFQAEHEARSKLLRLRALYVEHADDLPRLRALLVDSSKTFLVLMRHLIRLHGQAGTPGYEDVLRRFERHFTVTLPRIQQLIEIRSGRRPWPGEPLADFFHDYLAEVQQIVSVIDRLPPHPSSSHA
jgi:predicted nucleotidyltransferase